MHVAAKMTAGKVSSAELRWFSGFSALLLDQRLFVIAFFAWHPDSRRILHVCTNVGWFFHISVLMLSAKEPSPTRPLCLVLIKMSRKSSLRLHKMLFANAPDSSMTNWCHWLLMIIQWSKPRVWFYHGTLCCHVHSSRTSPSAIAADAILLHVRSFTCHDHRLVSSPERAVFAWRLAFMCHPCQRRERRGKRKQPKGARLRTRGWRRKELNALSGRVHGGDRTGAGTREKDN